MNPVIWNGTSNFTPGSTPFGFYDNDNQFRIEADKVANFVTTRLGYPITDVELQAKHIYAAFEEAVTEYGNEVYAFKLRDNYLTLEGAPSNQYLNNAVITPNLNMVIKMSEQYGNEVGVGPIPWISGSINIVSGIQDYDLAGYLTSAGYNSKEIRIQKVLWQEPAVYGGPYDINGVVGAGTSGTITNIDSYGTLYGDANFFMLQPINFDLANMQELEIARQVRRPNYSFDLQGTKLRIFPIPNYDTKLWFYFSSNDIMYSESIDNSCYSGSNGTYPRVGNVAGVPFTNPTYGLMNSISKQWIYEYTLALSMKTLAFIRGKYSTVPIPNDTVTLNSGDLFSQANDMADKLKEKLKLFLDDTSRKAQLERKQAESVARNSELANIPFTIYIG